MAQGKGGVPGGPPTQVNKLDNMLGSLQSDLNKLGVQTVAKGVCGACSKPIVGQVRCLCFSENNIWKSEGKKKTKHESQQCLADDNFFIRLGGDSHGPHMAS